MINAAKPRMIVGITGATGVCYGYRLLEILKSLEIETHLIMSRAALLTIKYEMDIKPKDFYDLADHHYATEDIGALIASGSFRTMGMIVAPCSIKTLSEIACGISSSLMTRAADVVLKERRRLVLMVRETPFHAGHLKSMLAVTEMGGIIAPPVTAMYIRPQNIEEMVDHSLARVLDLYDIEVPDASRWDPKLKR